MAPMASAPRISAPVDGVLMVRRAADFVDVRPLCTRALTQHLGQPRFADTSLAAQDDRLALTVDRLDHPLDVHGRLCQPNVGQPKDREKHSERKCDRLPHGAPLPEQPHVGDFPLQPV